MKNINTLFADAMEIMKDLNIEVGNITNVTWNSRLRSVWGRCKYNHRLDIYMIELNPILADDAVSYEAAMNTMIHEVLHAHKDRMCHTGAWKYCANLVNREYPIYDIERCTSAEAKDVADKIERNYRFIIKCLNCGSVSKYQRESKIVKLVRSYPGSCRCTCGSTNLKLFDN